MLLRSASAITARCARISLGVVCLGLWTCAGGHVNATAPTGLEELSLTGLQPKTWVPGTHVVLSGRSFVDASLGEPRVILTGKLGGQDIDVDVRDGVKYVDLEHVSFVVSPDLFGSATGAFQGQVTLTFTSTTDGRDYASPALATSFDAERELSPAATTMSMPSFVNDTITVQGQNFLLWAPDQPEEGKTVAVVSGCFQPQGMPSCNMVGPVEVPAYPKNAFDRTAATFPYATRISGIGPGTFKGAIALKNQQARGAVHQSMPINVTWQVQGPALDAATPLLASVGQYVFFHGGGFVGMRADDTATRDERTELHIDSGTFTPQGGQAVDMTGVVLVPIFSDGRTVQYVINSSDKLNGSMPGVFSGMVTPVITKGTTSVSGRAAQINLTIDQTKQVIWVHFTDDYVYALDWFGMRDADARIRSRIFEVARRDYQGVNIEFRADMPTDFSPRGFGVIDINGIDPTNAGGHGNFGLDNTQGKDVDNKRLFDHIGGYEALRQEDASPGYGGVFVQELLAYSEHPAGQQRQSFYSTIFDSVFDPFRADVGGLRLAAAEADGAPHLTDGGACPASDRATQIGCAIFVLGNLIGSTMAHEVGHSLGLAYPGVPMGAYHDCGDAPNRLMDHGPDAPFEEHAELAGQGPGVFCTDEYQYLRKILPSKVSPPNIKRPPCGTPGCDSSQ